MKKAEQKKDRLLAHLKKMGYDLHNRKMVLPSYVPIILAVAVLIFAFICLNLTQQNDALTRSNQFYASEYSIHSDSDLVQNMTLHSSEEYRDKMLNVDIGRYGYQDGKNIVMILSTGLLFALVFHGFRVISIG